jgi:hypothetical protein
MTISAKAIAAAISTVAACAISMPALAENCADTTFTALSATSCLGSFSGNLNGNASETTFLSTNFGGTFAYAGKSDDSSSGPFTANPGVSTNGVLTFDSAISGTFVIGLVSANQHSFYFFDALTPVTSLTFNSTAGVAENQNGIPQQLSHAALYLGTVAAVPEPGTYALLLAGLGAVGFVSVRRRR